MKTAIELLQETQDRLRRFGWCKEVLEDSTGRHCLMGGLNVADHECVTYPPTHLFHSDVQGSCARAPYGDAVRALKAAIARMHPGRDHSLSFPSSCGTALETDIVNWVVSFNNHPGTTWREVDALLTQAIEDLRLQALIEDLRLQALQAQVDEIEPELTLTREAVAA